MRGVNAPPILVTSDSAVEPIEMPGSDGNWLTSRFVGADDIAHDMHVNIVTFRPGGTIPFAETQLWSMVFTYFVAQLTIGSTQM